MATTKKSSTSKTARVMNLLSKNREETAPEIETPAAAVEEAPAAPAAAPEAAPVAQAPAAPAVAHSTTPPIISSMQADSVISDQVFSALESALDNELGVSAKEAPAPAAEPAPAPAPAPVTAPVVEPEPEVAPAPVAEPVAVPEPVAAPAPAAQSAPAPAPVAVAASVSEPIPAPVAAPVAEPVAEPAKPTPEPTAESRLPTRVYIDPDTVYVNVMEKLVEEKAMKYIEMFGLCQCKRCVADVKALALNRLDPKYVVMRVGEEVPRISLYEGKFSPSVTAQLLSACKIVMERPHHNRD